MRSPRDVGPILVLAGLVALLVGGYLLYPSFSRVVHHSDCVASGRMDC